MKTNDVKLPVANRISFWLMTEEGHEEYGRPEQFFDFTSVGDPLEMKTIADGLTWLKEKILKLTETKKPAPYLFIKGVNAGGKAGALYSYPVPAVQRNIEMLEKNIIATVEKWCADNGQKMNAPVYQSSLPPTDPLYSDERYLVITIDLKTTSL